MNKKNFIIRQIAKTNKKNDENYVVTRLWHMLDRTDVKMITQQHITLEKGRALTDVFFPQINLHIEIDESHHFKNKKENDPMTSDEVILLSEQRKKNDVKREADIINATGHEIQRIIVWKRSLEEINERVKELVGLINLKIEDLESFEEWNIEAEYNPLTYISKGRISVEDNVAFKKICDACNCFGHNYLGYQRGFAKHPNENKMIWFPKLYENEDWNNSISNNEETIFEIKKEGHDDYLKNTAFTLHDNKKERLVFARVKGVLGDTMYRFKGVYLLNIEKSKKKRQAIYERVSTEAKTYKSN